MKVLVQIPCLNESQTLDKVIQAIPKSIPGCDKVDVLVIDDGSKDDSVQVALRAGASLVISKYSTFGLAHSFRLGQAYFLSTDYDVLVNTDGDDQYFQEKIPELLRPILDKSADLVLGDRETSKLLHFSLIKRVLQRIGSRIVSFASGTKVPDAASGFRAYSRAAISKIFITTQFSYAMESIIQAGHKGLRIASVATGAKIVKRPSRLFKSTREHIQRSGLAIMKSFLMYRPLPILGGLSLVLFLIGVIPMARYIALVITNQAGEHLQSLLLGSLLITTAVVALVLGLVAELSRIHRELYEEERSLERLTNGPSLDSILISFSAFVRTQRL